MHAHEQVSFPFSWDLDEERRQLEMFEVTATAAHALLTDKKLLDLFDQAVRNQTKDCRAGSLRKADLRPRLAGTLVRSNKAPVFYVS